MNLSRRPVLLVTGFLFVLAAAASLNGSRPAADDPGARFAARITASPISPGQDAAQTRDIEIKSLTALNRIFPPYPDRLKEDGIAGEVAVLAVIGPKGTVQTASVFRPLHPELDAAALTAIQQWTFEPYLVDNVPTAVPAYFSFVFRPDSPGETAWNEGQAGAAQAAAPPESEELRLLIEKSGAYALKLAEAGRFFLCREEIEETIKDVREEETAFIMTSPGESARLIARYKYPVLRGGTQSVVRHDYRLVAKEGIVEEDRKPLGKTEAGTAPSYSLKPVLAPSLLLGPERRFLYRYRIAARGKIDGRPSVAVEVKPKQKGTGMIREAIVWVEEATFRVLRLEMAADALPGETRYREECARHHLTPHYMATYTYDVEKSNLLYPGRAEIRLDYSGLVNPPVETKADIRISYDRYRFFSKTPEDLQPER